MYILNVAFQQLLISYYNVFLRRNYPAARAYTWVRFKFIGLITFLCVSIIIDYRTWTMRYYVILITTESPGLQPPCAHAYDSKSRRIAACVTIM